MYGSQSILFVLFYFYLSEFHQYFIKGGKWKGYIFFLFRKPIAFQANILQSRDFLFCFSLAHFGVFLFPSFTIVDCHSSTNSKTYTYQFTQQPAFSLSSCVVLTHFFFIYEVVFCYLYFEGAGGVCGFVNHFALSIHDQKFVCFFFFLLYLARNGTILARFKSSNFICCYCCIEYQQ